MRITKSAEFIWSSKQDKYLLVKRNSSIIWTKVAWCKGASAAQNNLANSQSQFYNTLQSDYGQQFANQNAILGTLTNTLNPIIQAGPNQFGFSQGETNALNSQAIQGTGQQYNNAAASLKANQAAEGGGNALLPSGVASSQQASLAAQGANQASSELLGIQNAGYQQGHSQYEQAVGQLGGVASQYNPNGVAGAANSAGSSAFGSATEVNKENQAASPWGIISPLIGGALSGLTSGLTGGLLGGFGGGGNGSSGYSQAIIGGQNDLGGMGTGDETPYQI